jgi:hypothetical protein
MPEQPPIGPEHQPARFPWLSLTVVAVMAALLIALAEISRLSSDLLDTTGRSWAFSELIGAAAFTVGDGWLASYDAQAAAYREFLSRIYGYLDVVLIMIYGVVSTLVIIIRGVGRWLRRCYLLPLASCLIALGEVEALTQAAGKPLRPDLAPWMAGLSTLKGVLILAVLLVVGWLLLTPGRRSARKSYALIRAATRKHRLSILPVAIIGFVALTPAAEILDQLPDALRRWADLSNFEAIWAGLTLALLSIALFLLGRARLNLAVRNYPEPKLEQHKSKPTFWLYGPALFLISGLVILVAGYLSAGVVQVSMTRMAAVIAIPVIVWAGSMLVRWLEHRRAQRGDPLLLKPLKPKRVTWPELRAILVLGDILAVAPFLIGGLGAVRAFTAVAAVRVHDAQQAVAAGQPTSVAPALLFLTGGGLLIILSLPVAALIFHRMPVPLNLYGQQPSVRLAHATDVLVTHKDRVTRYVLALSVVEFIVIGCLPTLVAKIGVLAVFTLCVGVISGIVASGALIVQRRPPDELFRLIGLRSTPMITLFLLAVLFAGAVGTGTPIHLIRSLEAPPGTAQGQTSQPPTDPRPSLEQAFDTWRKDGQACVVEVPGLAGVVKVRPMIFVAAEGGGVRAAYWTTQGLLTLKSRADCAAHSTFLSSGVSGGAVGLTVARFNSDPLQAMRELSNSSALAAGVLGTFVRDFAYSASGVPLPALGESQPFVWSDRAALIGGVWNQSPPDWQNRSFVPATGEPAPEPITGQLILNSYGLGNACRIWVSQIRFAATPLDPADDPGQRGIDCDRPAQSSGTQPGTTAASKPALRSVDLISDYGPYVARMAEPKSSAKNLVDPDWNGCVYGLSAADAGLLAARFPYVTPSGVVGPCVVSDGSSSGTARRPTDQLLDGGYLENSGLGTVVDLAPDWLSLVKKANEQSYATDRVLIVPMILYLDNDTGNDRSAPKRDLTGEFLVPPVGKLRAINGLESDLSYLERSTGVLAPANFCPTTKLVECRAAANTLSRRRVVVVYQSSTPRVAAPLGWILSDASRDTMDAALVEQAGRWCDKLDRPRPNDEVCKRGFGTLGDLIDALNGTERQGP